MKALARKLFIIVAAGLLCASSASGQSAKRTAKSYIEGYWTCPVLMGMFSFNIHFDANGQCTVVTSGVDFEGGEPEKKIDKGTYSVSGNRISFDAAGTSEDGSLSGLVKDGPAEFYMPNIDTLELFGGGLILVLTRTNDYMFRDIE